jgi:Uma2 family endonuclease
MPTPHRLPRPPRGSYRWRDFVALADDDRRELLDGRLVEAEVPTRTHERIVAALIAVLGGWCWQHDAGEVLASGYKLRIDDRRGVMPDLQLYRRGNRARGQERGLERGRPDLVVEVLSPSTRAVDRHRKAEDYASLGVPEYWLVDPRERTLERRVLDGDGYRVAEVVSGNAPFRPDGFEGLEIDLARLWR